MADLTREQIERLRECRRSFSEAEIDTLCTMALRALDAGWRSMSTPTMSAIESVLDRAAREGYDDASEALAGFRAWRKAPPFTGDPATLDDRAPDARRTVAVDECHECGGLGNVARREPGYLITTTCPACNGTGKRGEHGK